MSTAFRQFLDHSRLLHLAPGQGIIRERGERGSSGDQGPATTSRFGLALELRLSDEPHRRIDSAKGLTMLRTRP